MVYSPSSGSGRIEEDDFINMMTDFMAGEKEDEFDVQELFNVFDGDQDGFVTFDELQVLCFTKPLALAFGILL